MKYPKVTQLKSGEVYVSINFNQKRVRLFNGSRLGIDLHPNSAPIERRLEIGNILAYEVYTKLKNNPKNYFESKRGLKIQKKYSHSEALEIALRDKLAMSNSNHHKQFLNYVHRLLSEEVGEGDLSKQSVYAILNRYSNKTSYNTVRAYILNICNQATMYGLPEDCFKPIARLRQKEMLHKPIIDLKELLEELKTFNHNLYLCCLLTYGCLLRPHREIRELTWGDFSRDLSSISVSGERNKSGRNRIVPVPRHIRTMLKRGELNLNIFSNDKSPYNQDYFKTLWGKFKNQSSTLKQEQTLYSFRHTAALNIYKRTGSVEKLRLAMGHSNIKVTLTYLRGLGTPLLTEEDMPQLPVLPAPEPPEPPEL